MASNNQAESVTSQWWEEFKQSVSSDTEVTQFANKLDIFNGHETAEKLEELTSELAHKNFNPYVVSKLERRMKVFEKRLSRKINSEFGPAIKAIRTQRGYSLHDLEKITGISASYINRMENGDRKAPSIIIIEALANALSVDKNTLIQAANVNTSEDKKVIDIYELLNFNEISINGALLTKFDKSSLMNMMVLIYQSAWTPESRSIDSVKLVEMVGNYKNLILSQRNKDS